MTRMSGTGIDGIRRNAAQSNPFRNPSGPGMQVQIHSDGRGWPQLRRKASCGLRFSEARLTESAQPRSLARHDARSGLSAPSRSGTASRAARSGPGRRTGTDGIAGPPVHARRTAASFPCPASGAILMAVRLERQPPDTHQSRGRQRPGPRPDHGPRACTACHGLAAEGRVRRAPARHAGAASRPSSGPPVAKRRGYPGRGGPERQTGPGRRPAPPAPTGSAPAHRTVAERSFISHPREPARAGAHFGTPPVRIGPHGSGSDGTDGAGWANAPAPPDQMWMTLPRPVPPALAPGRSRTVPAKLGPDISRPPRSRASGPKRPPCPEGRAGTGSSGSRGSCAPAPGPGAARITGCAAAARPR